MIKSPLKYTGNKDRLANYFKFEIFPKKIINFYDVFSGGGSVWMNTTAYKIFANDIEKNVILIHKWLNKTSFQKIIKEIELIANHYNLTLSHSNKYEYYKNIGLKKYNETGYLNMRKDYNNKNFIVHKEAHLYTMMLYSFNNIIRFNSSGKFNTPIGKTDFNQSVIKKIKSLKSLNKKIKFSTKDFRKILNQKFEKNDFIYLDPPYLITTAHYNEKGWGEKDEIDLYEALKNIDKKVKFCLSNVIEAKGKKNKILLKYAKENNWYITKVYYNYTSSSYNKKLRYSKTQEVVVTNYKISER